MASILNIAIEDYQNEPTQKDAFDQVESNEPHVAIQRLINYLQGLKAGSRRGLVAMEMENNGGTAAVWTIACTRANASGDTVTIAGVVLTEAVDFLRGADDTATGANLAAAINANATAKKEFYNLFASVASVTGTITLTARIKGTSGRMITIATGDATAFAITNTVTGANGTVSRGARVYDLGSGV
jgi:phage tail sheath gpL-like